MAKVRPADSRDAWVFVHTLSSHDAKAVAGLIERGSLRAQVLAGLSTLADEMSAGAGALLLSEESIADYAQRQLLVDALESQPAWSEIPVLIIGSSHGRRNGAVAQFHVGDYANVVLLERPLRFASLLSALKSALRARRKQYQIRDYLIERQQHEAELQSLNASLEHRVQERTKALELAHRSREQAERALREAQKTEAIGQLTGGIAHDFNNLLMVFTGGLSLLEKRWDDREQCDYIIKSMRQSAERGQALTKQLLAFARKMKLDPQPINLSTLLDEMRVLLGGALRGDIEVSFEVGERLWPLYADRTQVELALLNIAVNARDAMPQGGALKIAAGNQTLSARDGNDLEGDFVAITVSDTGRGIPSHLLGRVFDPFFTTKPIGKGTGLGLSQVFGFARQSGGTATIESEEGRGTRVTLFLPRSSHCASAPSRSPEAISTPLAHMDKSVLLVEDNDEVAGVGLRMLETLGFQVYRASNAREALEQLRARQFDVLFSDVVMPGGMNGLELAREAAILSPQMPIILASGYSDALQTGGHGFPLLEKPYQLATLEQALRSALGHTKQMPSSS